MTREEIIEHLDSIVGTYEILLGHGVNSDILDVDDIEAIKEAISALSENKGEWIPVSERLPEIHQDVLLSLRSLDVEVGFRAETEPYFYCHGADGCYIEPQNVIAWQPLPEPYKKGGEE